MNLSPIEYLRAAIANAIASGLSIHDLQEMAKHSRDLASFDRAVNILGEATAKDCADGSG